MFCPHSPLFHKPVLPDLITRQSLFMNHGGEVKRRTDTWFIPIMRIFHKSFIGLYFIQISPPSEWFREKSYLSPNIHQTYPHDRLWG